MDDAAQGGAVTEAWAAATIAEEVARFLARYTAHGIERDDLVSEGWLAYCRARDRADAEPGATRLRIRGALLDWVRRERRQTGRTRRTIRWPVYWPVTVARRRRPWTRTFSVPRCADCAARLVDASPWTRRCEGCRQERRRQQRQRDNAAYYARMQERGAA